MCPDELTSSNSTFFKEKLKELLCKRVCGIHVRQVQYELERYTGKQFKAEEHLDFLRFIYDCHQFLEVRSKEVPGGGKDLYIFIHRNELTSANTTNATEKTEERGHFRCETILEEPKQIFFSLPRFFRPKTFVPGRDRQPPPAPHDSNNCDGCRSALDVHYSTSVGNLLPKVIFPNGEFFVKLLGCDEKSYMFIRIEDRNDMWKKYKLMKQRLSSLSLENLQPLPIDSLKRGANILAHNIYSTNFFRAQIIDIDSDGSLTLHDVDTATQLQKVIESIYVLPEEFCSLPPRALKVALDKHTDYLGTDTLFNVFATVESYYNCEYVKTIHSENVSVPVVKLTEVDGGKIVSFHSLVEKS